MRNTALNASTLLISAALVLTGCTEAGPAAAPSPLQRPLNPASQIQATQEVEELNPAPPQVPHGYTGPRIEEPDPVPPCPYHEEVGAVHGVRAQVDLALELGCEADIYGEVTFTEPLPGGVHAIISVEHAMSVQEMCDEGIINEEDCAIELSY